MIAAAVTTTVTVLGNAAISVSNAIGTATNNIVYAVGDAISFDPVPIFYVPSTNPFTPSTGST